MQHSAAFQDDARFRLAMAAAGIGIGIASPAGAWREANPVLCMMLGLEREALAGRSLLDAIHPRNRGVAQEALARLASPGGGGSASFESAYLRAGGEAGQAAFDIAVLRAPDGAALEFIVQARDLTAQRHAEAALGELEAGMERKVRERTAELEATQRRLEAFTYGVSHDMRAPLRAIDGFAGQLERRAGEALDAQSRAHLARIRQASARMARLIDSLLELARISRAELRPTLVDVSLLLEWVAAELQDLHPQRPALVRVQPGLEVVGDEYLLKSLVTQLLRNAWQFSVSREQVVVEVDGERAGSMLRFSVRDRGIGFDPAYSAKLFEPFQRLHGSEEGAGNGIGLTIALQIAGRHGGAISAEGQPGAGARFHVELRDLECAGHAAQQRAAPQEQTA